METIFKIQILKGSKFWILVIGICFGFRASDFKFLLFRFQISNFGFLFFGFLIKI